MTPRPTPPPGEEAPRPPRRRAPGDTTPKAPRPRAAKAEEAKPQEAEPEEARTKPAKAKPATAAKAVKAKPSTAKSVTAKPVTAKSAKAKPVTAEQLTAKPVTAKSVTAKSSASRSAAAKSSSAGKSASAKPVKAKPVKTRPVKAVSVQEALSVDTGSGQPGPGQAGSGQAGSAEAVPVLVDAVRAVAMAADPVRAVSVDAEPVATVPAQSESVEPGAAGSPAPLPGHGVQPALPLGGEERARLLAGTHHEPHAVLGAHPAPAPGRGVLFRVLRPYAKAVDVVGGGLDASLFDEGDGLFAAVLPLADVPSYRLRVSYEDNEITVDDPYRFLPAIGELDLHLIGEGRHEELWKALGSEPMTHQGVTGTRFTVWAPNARGVRVVGDFNHWDGTGYPMRSLGGTGVWELFLPGVGEGALYKFQITRPDGSHTMRADPMARHAEVPPANASIVTAAHHEWQDADWMARRGERPVHEAPMSVYEIHLASWRPGLTYRQLAEQLPTYVSDLGFTHVELMPVAEHPFGGSWGYQVTGFYAPTSRMGGPDDFRFLVDALHRAGIGVIVDWVPAHFPRDDWALAEFDGRPLYEHEDPMKSAHPDWGTLEFDFGRTEVRNFLVANASYWCEEFHIDGLRVDAVASMLYLDYSREEGQWAPNAHGGRENLDAVAFLQEMNATVYRRNPGVVTIAEESTAWDGVTRATHHVGPGGFGGLGFGLKWNMGWMHDSLDYVAKEPVHRKYHHHEMTFSMVYAYSENYVLPISHDEVVHGKRALVSKMPGDWWQQRATHRAYLGFMWAHPGKQLLFMGQEFAQGAEWSEAHGPDWWLLDPSYGAEAEHRGVRDLVRDLNAGYRDAPALWERDTAPEGFSWVDGDAAEDNVFAFLRHDAAGNPLLAVSHFSPVVRHDYRIGVPDDVPAWTEVLNTDATGYGGSGVHNPEPLKPESVPHHGRPASIRITLPPLATVWFRPA